MIAGVMCNPAVGEATGHLREHRLIPLAIGRAIFALDVARQRHVTDVLE
jgi:hypothetical protein